MVSAADAEGIGEASEGLSHEQKTKQMCRVLFIFQSHLGKNVGVKSLVGHT